MGPIIASGAIVKPRLLVPAGPKQAVLFNIWDLGLQKGIVMNRVKVQHKVKYGFELSLIIPSGDFAGKRFCLYKDFTLSLHEKANLSKALSSWRGKPFTEAERKGFDITTMIGMGCIVNVVHTTKGDKTYDNIDSIMPLMDGMAPLTPENKREIPKWIEKIQAKALTPEQAAEIEREAALEPEAGPLTEADDSQIPF